MVFMYIVRSLTISLTIMLQLWHHLSTWSLALQLQGTHLVKRKGSELRLWMTVTRCWKTCLVCSFRKILFNLITVVFWIFWSLLFCTTIWRKKKEKLLIDIGVSYDYVMFAEHASGIGYSISWHQTLPCWNHFCKGLTQLFFYVTNCTEKCKQKLNTLVSKKNSLFVKTTLRVRCIAETHKQFCGNM